MAGADMIHLDVCMQLLVDTAQLWLWLARLWLSPAVRMKIQNTQKVLYCYVARTHTGS